MKIVNIMSHTHWDREWYRSDQAFLPRLVYTIDQLIETLQNNDKFLYYVLDGQTAVIEEYLKVRPEQRIAIEKLVNEKRLFIGPWFIQPDLNLVNGESLIRNLVIGRQIARTLGGSMQVGWIPDAFGQVADTSQLFAGFGMVGQYVWRGFNHTNLKHAIFNWRSKSGDMLPTVNFPLGYGHFRYFEDPEGNLEVMKNFIDATSDRYLGNFDLFMQGSDHARIQPNIPEIMAQLHRQLPDVKFQLTHPQKYLEDVLDLLSTKLEVIEGEARSSVTARIHAGINSTRMDIKSKMREYEMMIQHTVEPLATLCRLHGGKSSNKIVEHFWRILLYNQFHDSIYSSSPESVNQVVEARLLDLRHGLNEMIWLAHRYFLKQTDLSWINYEQPMISILNPNLKKITDARIEINAYLKDLNFSIVDYEGNEYPYRLLNESHHGSIEIENYRGLMHLNDETDVSNGKLFKRTIQLYDKTLDPFSHTLLKIVYGEQKQLKLEQTVQVSKNVVSNKWYTCTIEHDGSVTLLNHQTKAVIKNLLVYECREDLGDEYNFDPGVGLLWQSKNECVEVKVIEENERYVEIAWEHTCLVRGKTVMIQTMLACDETPFIQVQNEISNQANDFLLSVSIPTSEKRLKHVTDTHFSTIERLNDIPIDFDAKEIELPMYPLRQVVAMVNDNPSLVVHGQSISEYFILDDHRICLSLLRATGKLGKEDLLTRPGRASGYHLDTPSSQVHKTVLLSYRIGINQSSLAKVLSSNHAPIACRMVDQIKPYTSLNLKPNINADIAINGDVEVLTVKESEDQKGTIIRILNRSCLSAVTMNCRVDDRVFLTNLDEEIIEQKQNNQGSVLITLTPYQLVSIKIER